MVDIPIQFNKKTSYARIKKDRVVTVTMLIQDADTGESLVFQKELVYLHGGYGSALPRVEECLEGLSVKDRTEILLEPDEAYGDYDPSRVLVVSREQLPDEKISIGTAIDAVAEDGEQTHFQITAIKDGMVTLDPNHPLSGKRLFLDISVVDVREATQEEIEDGFGFVKKPMSN